MKLVTYVLALIYLASGTAKLAGLDFEIQAFARWGYPLWFMYATGIAEVAGAVLLLTRLSAAAAAGLAMLMTGALATHLLHGEWGMLAVASVVFATTAWRVWKGRGEIAALLRQPMAKAE